MHNGLSSFFRDSGDPGQGSDDPKATSKLIHRLQTWLSTKALSLQAVPEMFTECSDP
jgi:hypothetical protein